MAEKKFLSWIGFKDETSSRPAPAMEVSSSQPNQSNVARIRELESQLAELRSRRDITSLTKEEFESKLNLLKNKPKVKIKDFRIVDGFSEGLALAINSELDYGFVDNEGNVIIPFKFEHAENFKDDIAKVRYNGEFKSINKK